jgi:hypothetical protein
MKYNIKKKYGGSSAPPPPQTVETIPEWARPYMESVGKAAQEQYSSGALGRVAGATANQQTAFDMGKDIANIGKAGTATLQDQQERLKEMARTGGANELQDALKLDVGMSSANLGNQYGAAGVLGSARHALAEKTSEDAAKAKFAQQVIANKQAAEQALGKSVSDTLSQTSSAASGVARLGSEQRAIEQQIADKDWQALSRYSQAIYGNPARQQAVQPTGGK